MQADTHERIERFLLGKLSEDERLGIEERFLSDNDFFEQVLSVEGELIDQYLLGRLSQKDMAQAQALFQSSRYPAARVESTRSLISLIHAANSADGENSLDTLQPGRVSSADKSETASAAPGRIDLNGGPSLALAGSRTIAWRFQALSWVVAATAIISLVAWVVYLTNKKRVMETQLVRLEQMITDSDKNLNEITRQEEELNSERQRREKAEELLAQSRSPRPLRTTSVLLTATTFERGGNPKSVRLNLLAEQVRLQLAVDHPRPYDLYSVAITTFDNRTIFQSKSLNSRSMNQGRLNVVLPSSLFGYQDYKIELKGSADGGDFVQVADYVLKVSR